jgi:hypothetical protein
VTEDERAEAVIRAGVPVPAKDWTCVGCGATETIREPGRPAGVHGTVVIVDDQGRAGKPVDVWAHPKPRCIGGILRVLAGEAPETSESDEGETVSVSTLRGRRGKGSDLAAAEALSGAPASEREPEAAASN